MLGHCPSVATELSGFKKHNNFKDNLVPMFQCQVRGWHGEGDGEVTCGDHSSWPASPKSPWRSHLWSRGLET